VKPSNAWFEADPVVARDRLLLSALAAAIEAHRQQALAAGGDAWGKVHTATFRHVLGVTAAARQRFNVGPFVRPGYGDTVNSTWGSALDQTEGASYREILDASNWDRSIATSAPGQSESPSSAHFSDLARLWANGEYFPLSFSEGAVQSNAEATLVLEPPVPRP
jgi:penicillin amidase